MTLIIGIKCNEGVVVASDGAATMGSLGTRTVEQPTKKLDILQNKIIIGVSGPVGLGQRIKGEIDTLYASKDPVNGLLGKKPYETMTIISTKIRQHIFPELDAATRARNVIGNVALDSVLSASLVAIPLNTEAHLFQFDQQGAPEETLATLPYTSIGSGQTIADPFLGFIRRIFWQTSCPNLNDGIFAAVWTLQHAISVNPGGVSYPIQVATLKHDGKNWIAREYSDLELQEHNEAVTAAENKLLHFKETIVKASEAQDIPQPKKT